MKTKLASCLVLGFLLATNSSGAARSSQAAPDHQLVQITIGIYDYAHADPSVLHDAERTAARILGKAGVKTVWLDCHADDSSPLVAACAPPNVPATLLVFRILPDSMAKGFRRVHGDTLGFAALGEELSRDAWVFYDRVTDFSKRQQLTFERVLGAVIAHELGHLLLGETEHPNAGLMHGCWTRRELVAIECALLEFSDTEGKGIQSGARARHQAASAAMAKVSLSDLPTRLN